MNAAKIYQVKLTEREMQTLANAVAAFYNVANREDAEINPVQTATLQGVMEKFKRAIEPIEVIKDEIVTLSN